MVHNITCTPTRARTHVGMVHKYSTSVTFKHWFSIIMGLAYGWLLVGPSVYHFVLLCVVCYGLISAFPTRPVLTLAVCMTHLSALQIHRLITNYLSFNLDVAMLMMIAVCKLTFMAYNVSDGVMIRNAVEFNKKKKGTSKNEKEEEDADVDKSCMLFEVHPQYKYRKSMALEELPSLVEYFSFCFFFPGILVGPCFEFKTYITFSEGSFVHLNTIKPALTKVGYAVCCYLVMAIGGYFPVSGVLDQVCILLIDSVSIYVIILVWVGGESIPFTVHSRTGLNAYIW